MHAPCHARGRSVGVCQCEELPAAPRTPRCSAVKATSASQNFKNRPAVSSCRDGSAATFFLIAARPTLPFLLIESRFDGRRRDDGRDDIAQSPLTRCTFGPSDRPRAKTGHEIITDGGAPGMNLGSRAVGKFRGVGDRFGDHLRLQTRPDLRTPRPDHHVPRRRPSGCKYWDF